MKSGMKKAATSMAYTSVLLGLNGDQVNNRCGYDLVTTRRRPEIFLSAPLRAARGSPWVSLLV